MLTFSSLFVKVWRVKRVFHTQSMAKLREKVPITHFFLLVAAALCVESIVLMAWTLTSPLKYERSCINKNDATDFCITQTGTCSGDNIPVFLSLQFAIHFACLVYGSILCYQCRNLPTDFNEGTV